MKHDIGHKVRYHRRFYSACEIQMTKYDSADAVEQHHNAHDGWREGYNCRPASGDTRSNRKTSSSKTAASNAIKVRCQIGERASTANRA
jgi:hypothetical protein